MALQNRKVLFETPICHNTEVGTLRSCSAWIAKEGLPSSVGGTFAFDVGMLSGWNSEDDCEGSLL
jgi:hypothetical protein